MKIELVFTFANSFIPLCWLLLIVAPRWRVTQITILSGMIPAIYAMVYMVLILQYFGRNEGDFSSLSGVMKLFENPGAVTAGWIHYLAFDLFVGTWIVSNSQKLFIPHLWIVPCLLLAFLFGPIGLLLYLIIRSIKTKKILHENF